MTGIVLLDWNGTVVLDEERARRASNRALAEHGLAPLDFDRFRATFRLPLRDFFEDLGVPRSSSAAAETAWNDGMLGERPVLRAGAADAFARLGAAGIRIGVVSAAAQHVLDADVEAVGLDGVFDVVIGSAVDKHAVLSAELGDRVPALYVGDTAYDMECAALAGYLPVGASGGYTDVEGILAAGAEVVVADLTELLDIVAGLRATESDSVH
jgi:phosphoglycolate phosphatase